MLVRVAFTMNIDGGAWMLDHGLTHDDVRADVRRYIINGTLEHLDSLGMLVREEAS